MSDPMVSNAFLAQQFTSTEKAPGTSHVRTEAEAERVAKRIRGLFSKPNAGLNVYRIG